MASNTPPKKAPPPPPPVNKRLDRPQITLQIPGANPAPRGPPTANTVYWAPNMYQGMAPASPGSHASGPQMNPYFPPFNQMYHKKASDFMFKQFEGFKDFTMNTAKSGLSVGEKTAFWFFNKLKYWSKKWFTHFFLTLCLVLYSVMGAAIFMALEGPNEDKYDKNLTDVRKDLTAKIQHIVATKGTFDFFENIEEHLVQYENDYTECVKHIVNNDVVKKTWSFWNAMFYAGTIYTTIGENQWTFIIE